MAGRLFRQLQLQRTGSLLPAGRARYQPRRGCRGPDEPGARPASAFAPQELSSRLSSISRQRNCLRRWTIKEAVFKAAGTGCDRSPRLLDSGRSGRRTGDLRLDAARYRWQLLPCPGHWLCVAVRG